MTCYIANHRKKLRALARRELDLLRTLQRGKGDSEVLAFAEEVRAARVRVLQVQHSRISPCERNERLLKKMQEQIRLCLSTPLSDIVAEFRARLEHEGTTAGRVHPE
jgi:hypothetical protein